jgi:hypothetical protein
VHALRDTKKRFAQCGALFLRRSGNEIEQVHSTRTPNTMMNEAKPTGKILRGTEGVGTVTPQMLEERAREIARTDGRSQPNDLDRTRAREDLAGPASDSDKLPTTEEPGRDWQMPLVSTGEKAPTVRPEDDENIPEKLIQEGVEEADHDQRLRSEQKREY